MNSRNKPLHVVYLGESGFPIGLAAIQKMTLIGKSLIHAGAKVTVLNRKGRFSPSEEVDVEIEGIHEGIKYIHTSGTIYRPKGIFKRTWLKIVGKINEYRHLKKLKKEGNPIAAIVSTESFFHTFSYYLYSRLLGFPVAFNYVELLSSMQHRSALNLKINDFFMDRFMIKRMDAALPISELLKANFTKIAPQKPQFKIPVLCDFSLFDLPKRTPDEQYFLYCGSVGYKEIIDFILEAYAQIHQNAHVKLYLIVSGGSQEAYEQLNEDFERWGIKEKVKVFNNIPYSQLVDLYLHAIALLIPLRNTVQDTARFPHKIGEYLATGNPIITSNYGEVAYYFQDNVNALIADKYEVATFSDKMQYVLNNQAKAIEVGQNGKEYGLNNFNYLSYGEDLIQFLENLLPSKK